MPIATRDGNGGGRTPAREAILEAAQSLFATYGLRGTTVRAIARRSGLSNTLLYYYFPKKDDLLDALLEPPELPTPVIPDRWNSESCLETTRYVAAAFYRWVDRDEFLRMVLIECYAGNERVKSMLDKEIAVFTRTVASILEPACGTGEANDRAESLSFALVGLLWQAVMHHGPQYRIHLSTEPSRQRVEHTVLLALPEPESIVGAA